MSKSKKTIYRTENKFDPYMTKDVVTKYISDELNKNPKIKENFKFQNFKALFGILITVNVVVSHFHYIPYPQDYYILIACVLIYYATTYVYQRYEKKVEGDIFILFDDSQVNKQLGFGAELPLQCQFMTLTVYQLPMRSILTQQKIDIADYFDVYGYLVQQKTSKLVDGMLQDARKLIKS